MTKKRLTEMFQYAMASSGLSDDELSKLNPKLVATYMSAGYQTGVNRTLEREKVSLSISPFTITQRNIKPLVNKEGIPYQLNLKYSPMHIGENDGIRTVHPSGSSKENLWYQDTASDWIMEDMLAFAPNGTYDYSGSKVYLKVSKKIEMFDVALVPEFWSLKDTDEVPMPKNFEPQFIQITKEIVMKSYPRDIANDGK